MNRIDRISAILIMLQTRRVIKAEEIARRFEISKRTVYRDIRALEEAGVPIGAEAGVGYYLTEGYHLPSVMFTRYEAGSMLTAEKLVEKFTDHSIEKNFKSAMDKIKSVLPVSDKDFLEMLTPHIAILHQYDTSVTDFPNNFLSDIQHALATKSVVKIDYYSFYSDELTEGRLVEPIGICYYGFAWHLIGYCRLRDDYRDFRIDRIRNLALTDEKFSSANRIPLHEFLNGLYQSNNLEPVVIRFDKSIISFIEKPKYYYGYVDEKDIGNQVEMYFMIDSVEYLARWIIMHGSKAEIISPKKLKDIVRALAQELYQHYNKE
jgi:predicted DNA-binding transcriptional regulator YafY